MKLSKNFMLHEFAVSQTAARMGLPIVIPPYIIPALADLVVNILQPLRSDVRRSVWIQSGYRPPWLNEAVGGSKHSQHMLGEAADINVAGWVPQKTAKRIVALGLPFDQVILEFDQWVHVSHSQRNRREVLTARKVNGQTVYSPGLEY